MKFNRIILDNDVTKKLNILKKRTGLTPNILCRYGLILSLKEPTNPNPSVYKQDGQELMKHVLLGEFENVFIALFKQKMYKDGYNLENEKLLLEMLRAHINRGAELLYNRVKSLKDLVKLSVNNP